MVDREYCDFDLAISDIGEGRYQVRVLDSPSGQARCDFVLPFSALELENFMLRIGRPRRGVRRLESPEADAARTFGRQLCESVFSGDVGVAWQRSMDDAEREGLGLRLRLRLGDASELAELPWEYRYLPTADRHLVLSAWTPLVRYLDLPRAPKPLTVQPPLRLLAMVSSPSDYPALDTDTEWSKVSASLDPLEDAGMVEVTRLDTATLHELQRALRRTDYHVFHFIGHGGFDEQASDGILVLEDENNRSRRVTGHELGTILTDARSIRLAVLNSCEGARAGGADPFGGTAPTLVRGGIPAVVAMQFEITDAAAIVFAQELYAAVADGYPIDAAVAEARRAIFGAGNDVEWGTPVLYMRADDGRLFDVESDKRPSVVSTPDPQAEEHALEEAPEDVIAPLDSGSVEMDTEEIERIADVTDTVSDQPASLPEIEPLTEHPRPDNAGAAPEVGEPTTVAMEPVTEPDAEMSVPSDQAEAALTEITSVPEAPTEEPVEAPAKAPAEATEVEPEQPAEQPVDESPTADDGVPEPEPDDASDEQESPPFDGRVPRLVYVGATVFLSAIVLFNLLKPSEVQDTTTTATAAATTATAAATTATATAAATTAAVTTPQVVDSADVVAVRAPDGLSIDGDLSDWGSVTTSYRLVHEVPAGNATPLGVDSPGTIRVAYDDDGGLYLAAVVDDDVYSQPNVGDQIWRGDAIDLNLSTVAPEAASSVPDQDDFQLTMTPSNNAGQPSHAWFQGTGSSSFSRAETDRAVVVAGEPSNPDGAYTLEAFIPWYVFELDGPPDGDLTALFAVFDNDGELADGRSVQRTILGNVPGAGFQDPNTWGRLSFES